MIDAATRQRVGPRAEGKCEYCRLPELALALTFHVEHVVPVQHGGMDSADNLALACPRCNRMKGPNLASIDPQTMRIVMPFSPRRDRWERHFVAQGFRISGCSAIGRATVRLLDMNHSSRVRLRKHLAEAGDA